MKKIWIGVASALLAGTMVAFVGCGEGANSLKGDAKPQGNYQKVEQNNAALLDEAIKNISPETAFETEDGRMGLALEMAVKGSFEAKGPGFSIGMQGSANADLKVSAAELENGGIDLLGAGSAKVALKTQSEGVEEFPVLDLTAQANVYLNNFAVYLDAASTQSGTTDEAHFMCPLEGLAAAEGNIQEEINSYLTGSIGEALGAGSVSEGIALLYEYGFEIGIDVSNGLDIAIYATDAAFARATAYLQQAAASAGEGATALDIQFKKKEFSVNFVIGKDGKFEKAGISADIAANVKVTVSGMQMLDETFALEGGIVIKAYRNAITLPALDPDDYIEIDPSQIFEQMGGKVDYDHAVDYNDKEIG